MFISLGGLLVDVQVLGVRTGGRGGRSAGGESDGFECAADGSGVFGVVVGSGVFDARVEVEPATACLQGCRYVFRADTTGEQGLCANLGGNIREQPPVEGGTGAALPRVQDEAVHGVFGCERVGVLHRGSRSPGTRHRNCAPNLDAVRLSPIGRNRSGCVSRGPRPADQLEFLLEGGLQRGVNLNSTDAWEGELFEALGTARDRNVGEPGFRLHDGGRGFT